MFAFSIILHGNKKLFLKAQLTKRGAQFRHVPNLTKHILVSRTSVDSKSESKVGNTHGTFLDFCEKLA